MSNYKLISEGSFKDFERCINLFGKQGYSVHTFKVSNNKYIALMEQKHCTSPITIGGETYSYSPDELSNMQFVVDLKS